MRNKWCKVIKKYPVVIGIFGICVLMGCIGVYWIGQKKETVESKVVPVELAREQTVEEIIDPKQSVEYFLNAVKERDLDKMLRGFPIDEICLEVRTDELIEQAGKFSVDTLLAPSMEYPLYFPLSSAELTAFYAEKGQEWIEQSEKLGEWEIKEIGYVQPRQQMGTEYKYMASQQSSQWGADWICEMSALVTTESQTYRMVFKLISYYGYWKVFSFDSDILEVENDVCFVQSSEEEYRALTDAEKESELKEELDERVQSDKSEAEIEEAQERNREQLKNQTALFPPNYFVTNSAFESDPQETIRQFNRYLQKEDMEAALNYGNYYEGKDTEHVSEEMLIRQGDFAKQIKAMYYSIFRTKQGIEEQSLERLGESSSAIVDSLNPQYVFYLELLDIKETDIPSVYEVYYYYEGDYFEVIYEMEEFSEGWQIKNVGMARRLSEKEAEEYE